MNESSFDFLLPPTYQSALSWVTVIFISVGVAYGKGAIRWQEFQNCYVGAYVL